ncbi:MAG TPA: T9SS type A sorting domain-containing protein [bacterium]|jgi:hypothetical protein
MYFRRTALLLLLTVCSAVQAQDSLNVRLLGQLALTGNAVHVAVAGHYAYIVQSYLSGGLRVIDISNPSIPQLVGAYYTSGLTWGIAVRDSVAFMADGYGGLRILSIANPAYPVQLGRYDTPGFAYNVCVYGNSVYVADYNSMQILNISNLAAPTFVGSCPTGQVTGIAVVGNIVYAADNFPEIGLRIIDATNPAAPLQTGRYGDRGAVAGVAVVGTLAYLGAGDYGLTIVDVSNPAAPREVGHCDTPSILEDLVIQSHYVFAADARGELRIIDVADPSHPMEVGFYNMSYDARGVAVSGNTVYAVGNDWFRAYDCSAALSNAPSFRGYVELTHSGPPNWGYQLDWEAGAISRLIFTHFCSGTVGSVSGAAASSWSIMNNGDGNDGDSIIFITTQPLASGTLGTFWLAHPWCSDLVQYCVGEYCEDIDGPLPVELLSFIAVPGNSEVTLSWRTASDRNNRRFEISRDDAVVGLVPSEHNNTTGHNYGWTDRHLTNGRAYHYTLWAVDVSGQREELARADATPRWDTGTAISTYALHSAFPNPFNAETTIRFEVPVRAAARLAIYNLLGTRIATLVEGIQQPGEHSAVFHAENLPSGIYVCALETDYFHATTKVLLIR